MLNDFELCLKADFGVKHTTARKHSRYLEPFFEKYKYRVTVSDVRTYYLELKGRLSATSSADFVKACRRFFRDYLKTDILNDFKVSQTRSLKFKRIPTKEQFGQALECLDTKREQAIYLFYYSSGLRKGEVLKVKKSNLLPSIRGVVPEMTRGNKHTGITFVSKQCWEYLEDYWKTRRDKKDKVFRIRDSSYDDIWNKVSDSIGFRVTPQILRINFAVQCRMAGIPDTFVDIFQGRSPTSVLGQYYTQIGAEQLRKVYDKVEPVISLK